MKTQTPILAIDLGRTRTGLALSESGIFIKSLPTISTKGPHSHATLQQILDSVEEYAVKTVVFGLPLHQDESLSEQAHYVQEFRASLEECMAGKNLQVICVEQNEYYSSKLADQEHPTSQRDSAAAAIILQNFLESQS